MAYDTRHCCRGEFNNPLTSESAEISFVPTDAVEMSALKYVNFIRCDKHWLLYRVFAHILRAWSTELRPPDEAPALWEYRVTGHLRTAFKDRLFVNGWAISKPAFTAPAAVCRSFAL